MRVKDYLNEYNLPPGRIRKVKKEFKEYTKKRCMMYDDAQILSYLPTFLRDVVVHHAYHAVSARFVRCFVPQWTPFPFMAEAASIQLMTCSHGTCSWTRLAHLDIRTCVPLRLPGRDPFPYVQRCGRDVPRVSWRGGDTPHAYNGPCWRLDHRGGPEQSLVVHGVERGVGCDGQGFQLHPGERAELLSAAVCGVHPPHSPCTVPGFSAKLCVGGRCALGVSMVWQNLIGLVLCCGFHVRVVQELHIGDWFGEAHLVMPPAVWFVYKVSVQVVSAMFVDRKVAKPCGWQQCGSPTVFRSHPAGLVDQPCGRWRCDGACRGKRQRCST